MNLFRFTRCLSTSSLLAVAGALFLFGCSTVDSRINKNQAQFAAYSSADQGKIRQGVVDVGFTEDMVRMSLGDPDRIAERIAEGQLPSTVWGYSDRGSHFSFGVGIGSGGGGSSVGAGVSTSDRASGFGDKTRIIFQQGKVTAIERVKRT